MRVSKIMIIRHAEKPADDGSIAGISVSGGNDPEELTVRGWQRAGALVRFFAPTDGRFFHPALAMPDVLFASAVAKHSSSLRPQHTILPLADFLKKAPNLKHKKGEEDQLVADALDSRGAVLIAWEHEAIPDIVQKITGDGGICPRKWPGERFDLVWVLDPKAIGTGWQLTQVPQLLLPNDSSDPISF